MKRVTGIGGIFFKAKDPAKTKAWYAQHLGIPAGEYGATFEWRPKDDPEQLAITSWSPFKENTDYFDPADQDFMVNYRVDNLEELLKALEDEGVQQVGEMQTFEYGKFAWIMDPEGRKIELWEPVDGPLLT